MLRIPRHSRVAPGKIETKNKRREHPYHMSPGWLVSVLWKAKPNQKIRHNSRFPEFYHVVGKLKSNHLNQTHNTLQALNQQTLMRTISDVKMRLEKVVID